MTTGYYFRQQYRIMHHGRKKIATELINITKIHKVVI